MESIHFTEGETRLALERRLKFQGSAKINLDQIYFDPQTSHQLDRKNVDRLCKIFGEEECQNLTLEDHISAIVSRQHLVAALEAANVTAQTLLTGGTAEIPHLQFPRGQVQALHGQHQIEAGLEVLSPAYRWWAVDLYLDSEFHMLSILISVEG